jgi:pimeloyl-ACP methyl ester carboxylesterase
MREFFGHAVPRNEEDFQKTTYYANWRNAKWHNRWVCFERLETPLLIIHGAEDKAVAPFLGDQVFGALRRLGKDVDMRRAGPIDCCFWLEPPLPETGNLSHGTKNNPHPVPLVSLSQPCL